MQLPKPSLPALTRKVTPEIKDAAKPALRGEQGPRGPRGPEGPQGADGLSAFEIAVDHGFRGTEAQWLKSLQGKDGKDGKNGVGGGIVVQQQPAQLSGSYWPMGW